VLLRRRFVEKIFAFLRLHRHELFNDEFQVELEGSKAAITSSSPGFAAVSRSGKSSWRWQKPSMERR
jgi:hypothetical protein